jgi:hypothetical protein
MPLCAVIEIGDDILDKLYSELANAAAASYAAIRDSGQSFRG